MNGSGGQDKTPDRRPEWRGHDTGNGPMRRQSGDSRPELPSAADDSRLPQPGGHRVGAGQRSTIGVHPAVLANVLPAANWLFWSFVVVLWVSSAMGLERGAWIVVAVWLASGAVIFWRPTEDALAKFVLRLRQPTMAEVSRLGPIWYAVFHRAGVDPTPYKLWIEESEEISAAPAAGHTIAITRWSLYTLPPSHLSAVLAHEVAHQLGGFNWLSKLVFWYSLPARGALAVLRLLLRLIKTVPVLGCLIVGFLFLAYVGVIIAMLMFNESLLTPLLYFTPALAAPILAWVSRWSERNADKVAAELSYGPQLIEVFYGWQMRGPHAGRESGLRADLLSARPRISERIRALEKFLSHGG